MERIVSLLPSSTEIVCALGQGAALVGRSHECDFPPAVAALPALTEPRLDARAASRVIDDRVKQLVREGLSVYLVDAERLRELAPSIVLTQEQCDVCAASPKDVETALCAWTASRPRVVSLAPQTLGDVWADFVTVATALGVRERGEALAQELTTRITDVSERTQRLRPQPSVATIEWTEPLMAAGNWVPELISLAGGTNLFGETGRHSPWLTWQALRAADPDVLVVMPCGFDLALTRREMAPLAALPGFGELRAARAGRVYLTDGNQYFNRPGPRLAESLEILAEILHPEAFGAKQLGTGWEPYF